jgi:diguanylate cyclase (GGDEF)-like protein
MDIRTILVINFLYSLIVAITYAITYRDYAGSVRRSMKTLCIGMFLLACGWIFMAARETLPEYLSILLGNGCLLIGQIEILQAVRIFDENPTNRKKLLPLIVITMIILLYFCCKFNITSIRIAIISTTSAFFSLLTAIQLLKKNNDHFHRIRWFTGLSFILLALTYVYRLYDALFHDLQYPSFFSPSPMQATIFTSVLLSTFMITYGYLLMCNNRFNIELNKLAIIDPLSNMINRRGIHTFLEREIARSQRTHEPLALVIIDANRFKDVNDHYGHAAGDKAIIHIAKTIQKYIRSADIAGRLGGDEFVVVLTNTDESSAKIIADRISHAIADQPLVYHDFAINLSVCYGLAMLDLQFPNYDDLFLRADLALYLEKESYKATLV